MSTLVLALIAGAVVGLVLGGLGGGGSVLAVPAMIYLLGFSALAATTASIPPALLGGAVAGRIPAPVLTVAFSVIAALAAWRMLRPGRPPRPYAGPARAAGAGAGLGALTGVLGVGGGFLAVPALLSVLGLRMKAAVGTSLLVITINSLAALFTRAHTAGGLDWTVLAPFTGAAILGAWDGKRLAARLPAERLQRVFAYVLLAVAAFMLLDTLI
ncbi:sulfite exporter TauE/SafE family protein [Streptomyces sp. MH60]|uniref:sulfite exporter TauE/SafE family protein n=1 Tax=Streptomyces sp. MH60 TaxID=1940758 RepID=UPI000CEF309B|nr:sulfite exporter TauE/SafE family protein [Streptomyces sp. MH60]PPS85562.1 hypothetical protein BZZ08_03816 [Streptomyces sp. MH60]